MKKRVSGAVVAFALLAPTFQVADAATPYLSGSAALSMLRDSDDHTVSRSYDAGYALAGAAGLDGGKYRLEAELGYRNNGVKGSAAKISMTTCMANGYIDLELPLAPVKPFIMAGAGLAGVDEDNGHGSKSDDTVFAWQAGVGAGFAVAPLVNVDAQYRYFASSDAELDGHNKYSIGSHNLMLGLRVGF